MTDEHLESLFDGLRQENAEAHAATRRYFDATVEALRQENAAAQVETRRHFDVTAEALRHENAAAQVETRRHFDVTAEALRHEIRLVAEAVAQVDEREGREAERLDRGFADTQAMIKF